MRKYLINQKGQTLLELIIALLILVSVITATVTLIVTSINAGRDSTNRLIASSLAREGIEIVRDIRDSNWVDPSATAPSWDDGLSAGVLATPYVTTTSSGKLYYDQIDPLYYSTQIKLYSDQYLQGATQPGNGSQFFRMIKFNPICQDSSGLETIVVGNDCGSSVKVGIRVISEVHWPSENSNKKVLLEDRLYNWQIL